MTHEAFRMIIPGLFFWLPVFAVRLLELEDDASLVALASVLAAAVLPTGWVLYGGFRALRQMAGRTYETKRFVEMFRKRLRAVYSPGSRAVLLDFNALRPELGWWKLDIETYLETFCPFRKKKSSSSLDSAWVTRIPFLEHLSDLSLFKEASYDYARGIASVRYGLSCSLYSLVLGFVVAAGQYLVLRSAGFPSGITLAIAGWTLIVAVAVLVIYTLYRRRRDSSSEYDARLNLIVLSSLQLAKVSEPAPEPRGFREVIETLKDAPENPIAVFDLDNTLLIGDIQEALLARLLIGRRLSGFRWSEYLMMLEKEHEFAVRMAVQALAGLSVQSLERETRAILEERELHVVIEGDRVPMPRPHPGLQGLVAQLQTLGVECLVISASNQRSVEICSWELFGIPPGNVAGIRSDTTRRIFRRRLTGKLIEPAPIYEGKREALIKLRGSVRPVFVAGDSRSDYAMLRTCHQDGLILWVGDDPNEAEKLREDLKVTCRIRVVSRGSANH